MTDPNSTFVSKAFSKQAVVFDKLSGTNKISLYLRGIFHEEVISTGKPNGRILELNCGTGIDAVYLAGKGYEIVATDNAPGMLQQLNKKIEANNIKNIKAIRCSFNELTNLNEGKFDHIISNFGGLNCTDDLPAVLRQFSALLNPNGKVTLMIMPKVCPWELLMVFKGKFKTAFRRFKRGAPAHIEGVNFKCYYYNPGVVKKTLSPEFQITSLKGVCITVPPEFYLNFAERYPRLFRILKKIDKKIAGAFPFTHCCDHFLITLQKK